MKLARALLPTLAAVLTVALTVSLGNWQVRRASEKLEAQRQQEQALLAEPVRLGPAPLNEAEAAALAGRRVVVRGVLLPEHSVYVDNRSHKGIAGFHLVTPLRIEGADKQGGAGGEGYVLMLRGWLPRNPQERTQLLEPPVPDGEVELVGRAELELPQTLELKEPEPPGPEQRIWQNLTRERFSRWSGLVLQPLVIRQIEATRVVDPVTGDFREVDDTLARDWVQPGPDVAKHRGYAFQWYSLAAVAAALWLWFVIVAPLRARHSRERGAR